MNCPKCGSTVKENQKFCTNCGGKIHKEPTPLEKALNYCSNHWQKILLLLLIIITTIFTLKLYNFVQINNAMNNKDFDGQKVLVQNIRKEKFNGIQDFLNRRLEDKYHGFVYIHKIFNDKAIIYVENNINPNDIITYLSSLKLKLKKQSNRNNSWLDTDLNGNYVKKAYVTTCTSGEWCIGIEFTKEGKEKFAQLTREQTGKQLAIFFNNELITAPFIREPITSGFMQITNDFTFEEAEQMARILSVGLEFKILEVK